MNPLSTTIGLCLALGGPLLLASFGDKYLGSPKSITNKILQQIILALLLIAVLAIALVWEKQPLSSVGLHPLRWQSIAWGFLFAGFFIFIYSPLLIRAMNKLKLGSFDHGLTELTKLPIWYLILAVVVGGIVEEGLYRGYAIERLSLLIGSYVFGSILVLIAFGLAHLPLWGWGAALTTVISGAILTVFYLWTGELIAVIVAHVITDSVGIIIPAIAQLKKT